MSIFQHGDILRLFLAKRETASLLTKSVGSEFPSPLCTRRGMRARSLTEGGRFPTSPTFELTKGREGKRRTWNRE
jgi:hypothetical protein